MAYSILLPSHSAPSKESSGLLQRRDIACRPTLQVAEHSDQSANSHQAPSVNWYTRTTLRWPIQSYARREDNTYTNFSMVNIQTNVERTFYELTVIVGLSAHPFGAGSERKNEHT